MTDSARRIRAAALMQDGVDIGARRAKRGRQAGVNGSEKDRRQRIGKDAPIKAKAEANRKPGQMRNGTDEPAQPCAEKHAGDPAKQSSEDGFREHLPDQARARTTKSRAN